MSKYSIAIIGGGPAGFYMAKLLSKHPFQPIVHIYEKQLLPFGLLRYGVAPDHIAIKKAENTLGEVSKYPFFKYFGNTPINKQKFSKLRNSYSGVVYAYGASQNSLLGFQDFPARKFIYWYNSHPQAQKVPLQNVKNVVIIGNGNVSIDIARILLKDSVKLSKTDINLQTLEQLKRSNVKNVHIVGRRGIVQSSFTLKQIRQLKTQGIPMYMLNEQIQKSLNEATKIQTTVDNSSSLLNTLRANKRKLTFLAQNSKICHSQQQLRNVLQNDNKKMILRFLLQPKGRDGKQVIFNKTQLKGMAFNQKSFQTNQEARIQTDLLISSMGFKSVALVDQHFDNIKSVTSNVNGLVTRNGKIDIGVYATGWAKTGATGIIDNTLLNCEQTYNNLRIHMQQGILQKKQPSVLESDEAAFGFQEYLRVKQQEFNRGKKQQRDRVKMSNKQIKQFIKRK